jgi:predicted TIM-barrel fold metal-dependent hydrolase
MPPSPLTRRRFLVASAAAACAAGCAHSRPPAAAADKPLRIIDLHQHTNYSGRTDEQLHAHQKNMGVALTILLPGGRSVNSSTTHMGKSDGLAVKAGANESCYRLVQQFPDRYRFFANEVPDLPDTRGEIEKYLKLGALGIGEQKFNIDVESPPFDTVARLATDYDVPVLVHFQTGMYNHGYDRFHRVLEKYPKTRFIAHAQTTWANIDKAYKDDAKNLYPKTAPVTPGGLTDRYLTDYPHFYADMSAGSGLNALNRDPQHARAFLDRHQDKIIYGSDCNDTTGKPPLCQGALTIAAIKNLTTPAVARKILQGNAEKMFRL